LYTVRYAGAKVARDRKISKEPVGTPEIRYPPDFTKLMIAKFSEELTLPKGTTLGVAQDISENLAASAMRKILIELQNRLFWKQ
jgi:hypothetical protein